MLKELQAKFLQETIQIVIVDKECNVLESDNTLLSMRKGSQLADFHPFFHSIPGLFSEQEKKNHFYCVQMEVLGRSRFFDIKTQVLKKEGQIILFIQDLTDHYKSVHQIKQVRNESIIQFNVSQEINHELEVQRGFKNKFLANVSHEIRTPLNSIKGFLNVLQNTALDREQLDLVNIIMSSSDNLVSIVDDLLDISKIEAGHLEIKNKRFDFKELMQELSTTYSLVSEDKALEFVAEIGDNIPRFLILDRLRLNQILVNLLQNAVKYTHKGSITLRVSTPSRNMRRIPLTFEVIDTGIGIAAENTAAIFNSFTQIEKRGLFGGTGLGLSIVKQLAELMDGSIEVDSTEGSGSTFRFTLNVGVSHDQKKEKVVRERTSKKSRDEGPANKRYRILLGEDVEVNQLLMMKLFADHPEYSLDIATNGERVLKFLENYKYDLVLMDLTMPIMDGYDATARIRGHENKVIKKIPIVALTARISEEEKEECRKIGMNAYLTKPLDTDKMFNTIHKLINKYKRNTVKA